MSMRTILDARVFSNGNGSRFLECQIFDGRWGYDWEYFEVEGNRFLAYADHQDARSSIDGTANISNISSFSPNAAAAVSKFFEADGNAYLAFANILGDSALCRWNARPFRNTGASRRGRTVVRGRDLGQGYLSYPHQFHRGDAGPAEKPT